MENLTLSGYINAKETVGNVAEQLPQRERKDGVTEQELEQTKDRKL